MLQSRTSQLLFKNLAKAQNARLSYNAASSNLRVATPLQKFNAKRPTAIRSIARPTVTSLLYATKPENSVDRTDEGGGDMLAGVKADWAVVKETFSMADVPKESLYLGLAGLLPYVATSASTVALSYEINHAHIYGSGVFFTPELAHQLLDIITPVQIGFGAVIISFLGAIHWGLEYAGYGGHQSYRRYMVGVAAPAIAWPTTFMPIEYALITQFLAFTSLYFVDARATAKGWFPSWYGTYRFVLTFVVGASIVASLVGRGQIISSDGRLKSSVDYIKEDRDAQWTALEKEERDRRAALAAEEDEEEEESEEEDKTEEDDD